MRTREFGGQAAVMLSSSMSRTLSDAMKTTPCHRFNTVNLPLLLFSLLSLVATPVEARVKLVALPERARVVVSLNNPDATLVEEERLITLQKGVNKVDFSWRGVNIDPTSSQVRMLTHPDAVTALNTSYPHNENALIWEISSPAAQEERVRISYLLSGLSRDVTYRAVAEPNEKAMTLRNYLRLHNN